MAPETPIESVFRLTSQQKSALKKLGIGTLSDILFHFPLRYNRLVEARTIDSLIAGEEATIYGQIRNLSLKKAFIRKIPMAEGVIHDQTGSIKVVWFHQAYLAKMIQEGAAVRASGKVTTRKNELYLANPEIEVIPEIPLSSKESLFGSDTNDLFAYPIYPESRGITSRWFYHAIQKIIRGGILDQIEETIPEEILNRYNLPAIRSALIFIHSPKREEDGVVARKRFAFEEVFLIQLVKNQEKKAYERESGISISPSTELIEEFLERFPFSPTKAQRKAIEDILSDMKSGKPMSRLLEGDVGSGKTAVAATTAYATVTSRPRNQNFGTLQVAYMAPTEILASQHFESFIKYFSHLPINIGLITGSGCRKFPSKVNPSGWTTISRPQLLKWTANGEIAILIGTHALIQKTVRFKDLAYIVIDEQHRFGTAQRHKLARKESVLPHLLSMTATPIPRTLALTVYGDLDLTLLDEMPAGRKKIITEIIAPPKRDTVYEKIRGELKAGRQAYVICPRIDEPDPSKELALEAKSVKAEAKRLKKDVFPEYEIGVLHSKMKPAEKDRIMTEFSEGKIHILAATSVVEVGVNVPNATSIIIEGAERFGLAQLHQLRGRVVRSNHQAYCYLFAEAKTGKTMERLKALTQAANGFELAELDLKLRGAGELYGRKQWGISDLGMEAMKNIKMVEAARTEARNLIEKDPELKKYPVLKKRAFQYQNKFHFE